MYLTLAKFSLWVSRSVEEFKLARDLRQQMRREKRFCAIVSKLNKLMLEASADEDAFTSIFYDGHNLSLQVHDSVTGRNVFVVSYPFSHAIAMRAPGASAPASEELDEDDEDDDEDAVT